MFISINIVLVAYDMAGWQIQLLTCNVMIASLLRQNDIDTSFRRNIDVIIDMILRSEISVCNIIYDSHDMTNVILSHVPCPSWVWLWMVASNCGTVLELSIDFSFLSKKSSMKYWLGISLMQFKIYVFIDHLTLHDRAHFVPFPDVCFLPCVLSTSTIYGQYATNTNFKPNDVSYWHFREYLTMLCDICLICLA